jgi:hypothetical protein
MLNVKTVECFIISKIPPLKADPVTAKLPDIYHYCNLGKSLDHWKISEGAWYLTYFIKQSFILSLVLHEIFLN